MSSSRHTSHVCDGTPAGTPSAASVAADAGYLDAARSAILAVGWSRATLTDIARRARVSRMTLYRRWPDTQTLLADLMTREWGQVLAEATAAPVSEDPLENLRRAVVATVRGLRANELLRRIIDVDPEVLLPYLLDRRGRSQELLASALADLIRSGQDYGSIRTGDPHLLARSLLLACQGFVLSAHTMTAEAAPSRDADVTDFDAELTRLVERFLVP